MPWEVEKDTDACPVSRPWAVKQEGSGEVIGCHQTKTGAEAQMAALYASESTKRSASMPVQTPSLEVRSMPGSEVRDIDEGKREVLARVVTYGVADWYGTVWEPRVFDEGLREKLPKAVWSHDRRDIIGRVIDYDDTAEALEVRAKMSDFDAVPRAKQAFVQLRDGDIDEWSFAFDRQEWTEVNDKDHPEIWERMTKAKMIEVSPVLEGAVPGTATLDVRSRNAGIPSLGEIAREVIRIIDLRTVRTTLAPGEQVFTREDIRQMSESGPVVESKDEEGDEIVEQGGNEPTADLQETEESDETERSKPEVNEREVDGALRMSRNVRSTLLRTRR